MRLNITTREGTCVPIVADAGRSVMEVLRDRGEVEAACGGECVCATCHVHVDLDWIGVVGDAGELESALLDCSMERRPNSRLSCQIRLTNDMDGLALSVAAAEG
jgi:2Fe-2S ferredoxin